MKRTALALLLVVVGGCGGGSQTVTQQAGRASAARMPVFFDHEHSMTHAELGAALDRICVAFNAAVVKKRSGYANAVYTGDYERAARILESLLPLYDERREQQRTLRPPREDDQALARYIQLVDRSRALLVRMADALRRKDVDALSRLAMAVRAQARKLLDAAPGVGAVKCWNANAQRSSWKTWITSALAHRR